MDRESFYKLLVNVLTTIEKERFFFSIGSEEKLSCPDINHIITFSYLVYKVHLKNVVLFEEKVKDQEKHDFVYYQGNIEEFENNNIIGLKKIKEVLISRVIEFPYLTYLYKVIKELFVDHETGVLKLNDEQIKKVSNLVSIYAETMKNTENKLNIQRKRNHD